MSKHTPGPWEFEVETNDSGGWRARAQCVRIWNGATLIADYDTSACEYADDDENAANARLMAAAPELLAALIDMDEAYCDVGPDMTQEKRNFGRKTLIAARAAIAKATGEPQ